MCAEVAHSNDNTPIIFYLQILLDRSQISTSEYWLELQALTIFGINNYATRASASFITHPLSGTYYNRVPTVISLKSCHERFAVFNFLHNFLEIKWQQINNPSSLILTNLESDLQL